MHDACFHLLSLDDLSKSCVSQQHGQGKEPVGAGVAGGADRQLDAGRTKGL
jgi:hypothetical protein